MNRPIAFAVLLCFTGAVSASDVDNVRAVQTKLKEDGFYSGEVDGAYSSQLSAALTRYQIRNGLPITGQLDVDTSKALGAEPAVTTRTQGRVAIDAAPASETWRRLRKKDEEFLKNLDARGRAVAGTTKLKADAANRTSQSPGAAAPPAESPTVGQVEPEPSNRESSSRIVERLRDYVGAFVLAGLDPQVGAETDFFADQVRYYNEGVKDRQAIRRDLERYNARWPERKFWLDGDIAVTGEKDNLLRVTFPLRFELHNGKKKSAGKVEKTIVLETAGDDWQIVAVNER
jgi:peptidoglycan hydrolase-like protein with peptidoglycan-binding domain